MTLLLGIDEGTSAVKAVLYDAELRPLAEARREKRLSYPRSGWVEQDATEVLTAVVDAVGELLAGAAEPVTACGLDHQGESVLAWDADTGRPLTPIVTWQDKRSQEVLDRLEAAGQAEEVTTRSGMPLDPYFSAGKLAWLLEHDTGRPASARGRDAADGDGRLVPVRPARGRVRHRSVDRVAHPARQPRSGIRPCSNCSACRRACCRRSPTPRESSGRSATSRGPRSCRYGRGASISRRRLREQAACGPGW